MHCAPPLIFQLAGLPDSQMAGSVSLLGATFHTYPVTQVTSTTVSTIGVLGIEALYGYDIVVGHTAAKRSIN